MANLQIPEELFLLLYKYHCLGLRDQDLQDLIRKGLEGKMDALVARSLYTESKAAATQEQRERARQEYLERKGIPAAWRW